MYQTIEQAFAGFDFCLLSFWHTAAKQAGGFLTPLFRVITFLGEKGILLFLIAAILLCRPRTRRVGLCMFGAVSCGALITNMILKDLIARPRPFLSETVAEFAAWWQYVGAPAEEGFSFPSGHMTAATAGVCALLLLFYKRWYTWLAGLWVVLMAFSRCYLMAHYPSDVLAAALVGAVSALIAFAITRLIYWVLTRYADRCGVCKFLLQFDLLHPTARLKENEEKKEG